MLYSSYLGRNTHQLWVLPAEGGSDAFPLSYGEDDAVGARWSPDGRTIGFISNGKLAPDAKTVFFNAGDLGFGRSMRMKRKVGADSNTDVAFYVSNHDTVDHARTGRSLARVLLLALFHEEHEAGADAQAAQQAAHHIQPAQQPVFEVLQVQPGEELVHGRGGRTRRVFVQHASGAGLEVDALAQASLSYALLDINRGLAASANAA